MKKIIKKIVLKKKYINIDLKSDINSDIKNKSPNKMYPVNINNSIVKCREVNEGVEIGNAVCMGNIYIGRFASIMGPGTIISSVLSEIVIKGFSSIGQNVNIQDSNHRYDKMTSYFTARNIFNDSVEFDLDTKGRVVIEEDVWIGSNTSILSGVTIGRGAVIGAGSVVTKDIPAYSIAFGNPAKIHKKRFSKEVIKYLEDIKWWEWDIDKIFENKELFYKNLAETDLNILRRE